jgi:hypothetical protein
MQEVLHVGDVSTGDHDLLADGRVVWNLQYVLEMVWREVRGEARGERREGRGERGEGRGEEGKRGRGEDIRAKVSDVVIKSSVSRFSC